METRVHPLSIRDAALKAIGRNVVNFQKLEQCLKVLLRTGNVSGPVSAVQDKVARRISKSSAYTLGKAVQEWLRISTFDETTRPTTQDLFEPWISISVEGLINLERLAEHNEALNTLASERNSLIHQTLANFNFDSEADCQNLIASLDGQNARILEQLTFLAPAIKGLIDMNKWISRTELQDELFNAFVAQQNQNGT